MGEQKKITPKLLPVKGVGVGEQKKGVAQLAWSKKKRKGPASLELKREWPS